MKLFLRLLFLSFFAVVLGQFLDCSDNKKPLNPLIRCCISYQLPKGCECFEISKKSNFTNSQFMLPECPMFQRVDFRVFSRSNPDQGTQIKAGLSLIRTHFHPEKQTKFIVHGYLMADSEEWVIGMKDALLSEGDMNVIIVDWTHGAKPPVYPQAVANTRVVGAMIAHLVQDLKRYKRILFEKVHLIGHSLGAHVCGYAGKEVYRLTDRKIGRITGLDPAEANFDGCAANVRLSKNDAEFVDVIHTNANSSINTGRGISYSIGDVDFYPNGGRRQPNCPRVNIFRKPCNHEMAHIFFTNSISACPSQGFRCRMGYHVSRNCTGDYYPTTTRRLPYCDLSTFTLSG